jgi:hypothetical protein
LNRRFRVSTISSPVSGHGKVDPSHPGVVASGAAARSWVSLDVGVEEFPRTGIAVLTSFGSLR